MNDEPPERTTSSARKRARDLRLRLAFLAGAEEHSRLTLGRGLTDEELARVIRRFPTSAPRS